MTNNNMTQEAARKRLDEIRDRIKGEWRTILPRLCGDPIGKHAGEAMYVCPICGAGSHNHNSGIVYNPQNDNLRCNYGCDFSGDIISLYQQIAGGMKYKDALEYMAREIGIPDDMAELRRIAYSGSGAAQKTRRDVPGYDWNENISYTAEESAPAADKAATETQPADYREYYKQCAARIEDPEAVAYLAKRGLSIETAKACFIGYDPAADPAGNPGGLKAYSAHPAPRLIIPVTRAHYVGRAIDPDTDPKYKKLNSKGSTSGIFETREKAAHEVQNVFIVEGAIDALSIMEAGAHAIGLNSTSNIDTLLQQLEAQPTTATYIVCLDKDAEGIASTAKLQAGLDRLNIKNIVADVCNGYKDPNEALTGDREAFIAAVRSAELKAAAESPDSGVKALDDFLQIVTSSERYRPIPTGINKFDQRIGGGLINQSLILLGAEPGAGKTALAAQIFEHFAKAGRQCVYLNLEMSVEQLLARALSRVAYTQGIQLNSLSILRGYAMSIDQREAVRKAADEYRAAIAPNMLYNPDETSANLDAILQSIEKRAIRAEKQGKPAPVVCIDYLQLLTGKEREDNAEILKRAVVGFKDYAKRHDSIVFAIMAQSRAANNADKASMTAGRDTSNLEYTADLQLQLMRDEDDVTGTKRKLFITKSRFSEASLTDAVDLLFIGKTSTFLDPDAPGVFVPVGSENPFTGLQMAHGRVKKR